MSLLWNIVNYKNDPTKTKVEQLKACIENLEIKDLELMLEECNYTEFTEVILELIKERKQPKLA